MPNTRFDRFYRYNALTRLLKAYAKEYPGLIRLRSIGKSYEGRDVWLIRECLVWSIGEGVDVEETDCKAQGHHACEFKITTGRLT